MKQKKQQFRCAGCGISVSQAHPHCQRCDRQMEVNGNSFMDYVGIHNLHESSHYEGLYIFDLSLGPVKIKGLTYNKAGKGAIRFPKCTMRGYSTRPVYAFGKFVNAIRDRLKRAIEKFDSEGSTEEEHEPVDMEV